MKTPLPRLARTLLVSSFAWSIASAIAQEKEDGK